MLTVETDQSRATPVETGSSVEEADVAIAAHVAKGKDHPAIRMIGALSEVGDQPPLVALSGAFLAYGLIAGNRRAAQAGTRMLGALALASCIKTGLKHMVARTRPNVLLDEGRYEVEPFGPDQGAWHSFPSGHTAGSVAVARALGRTYPSAGPAAYLSAAAIAMAQVRRGAHYPLDVAAGALIGLAAEAAVDRLARHLADRFDSGPAPDDAAPEWADGAGASPPYDRGRERVTCAGEGIAATAGRDPAPPHP
jgi:membrane-associated phospholipid phosphatase